MLLFRFTLHLLPARIHYIQRTLAAVSSEHLISRLLFKTL